MLLIQNSGSVMSVTTERMLQAVQEYPESFKGLNRFSIRYRGRNYGSPWEVVLARKLYKAGVKHREPKHRIIYRWENSSRTYLPDFYLPDHDIYIEVKGYITTRDIQKWKNCAGKLIVLTGTAIQRLKRGFPVKIFTHLNKDEIIINETRVKTKRLRINAVKRIHAAYKIRLTPAQVSAAIKRGIQNSEYCIQRSKEAKEEAIIRRSRLNSSYSGSNNSQYGSFWITNGKTNKKWKESLGNLPRGYKKEGP